MSMARSKNPRVQFVCGLDNRTARAVTRTPGECVHLVRDGRCGVELMGGVPNEDKKEYLVCVI
jgi:hypothetical protein